MYKTRIILLCAYMTFWGCTGETDPLSVISPTYKTPYGTVTQIDDYPLFRLDYSSDYKFNEYLETGYIPNYSVVNTTSVKFGCTCFSAFGNYQRLLGRNYDWQTHATYFIVFTNPVDGYASVSTVDLGFFNYNHQDPPVSVQNQEVLRTLPYFPFDGLNEKGVAVGMNALPYAQAPYDNSKVTIGELQLIRLVLDYASSTGHALNLIRQYNIRMEDPPVHYLIADSSGQSAIIEFVNGRMEVFENEQPWQVTTNFIINGLSDHTNAPCWRYKTAYEKLEEAKGNLSLQEVSNLLQDVSVPATRWSNIFNMKAGTITTALGRNYDTLYNFSVTETHKSD